ncbi:MAG: cytochrome c4 [Chromatiaceae bacterium]|nr:cytochrome c4 [Gammaproteobacteria bacterium]MCP5316896.1 cytochrome c4 [Chromatiaceae bacterium]MCP5434428.1 cytochrome c4 [Chromatiaceae bacterium]HOP18314.1 cytochrome c4 [Gammaproteobacteria bacterium]HPQ24575.1 cytochrome c4 [Gammaproteobacteria bacterium]
MKKTVRHLLLALLATFPTAQAAGPTAQALAFTCAGCHGTDGSSVGPSSPSIAGMDPDVFVDAMLDYKNERRSSTIMKRIALGYTDEQIREMGFFFYRQPLRVKPQQTDPEMVALGKSLHDSYCEKCHEEGGRPGDAGTLAGQWMPYLEHAMSDYLNDQRRWPRKMERKVKEVVKAEGERAIPALIQYYGSQN